MKKRFLTMLFISTLSAAMLCACGKEPAQETNQTVEESSEESSTSGGEVSLDASVTDTFGMEFDCDDL